MDFSFTAEQEGLRSTVRDVVGRHADLRGALATGHDAPLWQVLCEQLALPGLAVAEEFGGQGGTWVDLAVALEEAGRALLAVPLLATTVAAAAIERSGSGEGAELLRRIASGEVTATLAVVDAGGCAAHVIEGQLADLFVVVDPDQLCVVAASAVVRTPVQTLDQTRGQARVELGAADRLVLGGADAAATALDLCRVALAVESVGAARRCLELTVEHLKTRVQFGKPLGSFQALKHRAADLAVELEAATSMAYYAAWAAADAPAELPLVAPAAKAYCTSTFLHVAAEMIQLHGGIGFTWEHDAHLYFKRAKANELLFGDPAAQRRLVAERVRL